MKLVHIHLRVRPHPRLLTARACTQQWFGASLAQTHAKRASHTQWANQMWTHPYSSCIHKYNENFHYPPTTKGVGRLHCIGTYQIITCFVTRLIDRFIASILFNISRRRTAILLTSKTQPLLPHAITAPPNGAI